MSFLCSICQDFLTERPQTFTRTDDELVISALQCGHMFHQICVTEWFRSYTERIREGGNQVPEAGNGSCPCCKKAVSLSNALRVFPTGDEDSNLIVEQKKTLDNVLAENQKLISEMSDMKLEFQRVSSELEEEIVAHDMLKMEYGQTLSKLEAVREQARDDLDMRATLENSVKTEMDKLKKDKKEALRTIAEMEARERKLLAEMESFRISDKENIRIPTAFQRGQVSLLPRENTQNISKGINVMIMKPGCDETSDGESPSGSPSTPEPKQHCIPLDVPLVPYSEDEPVYDV